MHKQTIPIIHIIGLPGAGKTTLAQRLSKVLRVPVFCIGGHRARFPKTPIGEADAWFDYRDKQGNLKPVKFISYIWKRIDGFIIDSLKKEIIFDRKFLNYA